MKLNNKKVEFGSFKNLNFSEIDRAHGVSFPTVFSQWIIISWKVQIQKQAKVFVTFQASTVHVFSTGFRHSHWGFAFYRFKQQAVKF